MPAMPITRIVAVLTALLVVLGVPVLPAAAGAAAGDRPAQIGSVYAPTPPVVRASATHDIVYVSWEPPADLPEDEAVESYEARIRPTSGEWSQEVQISADQSSTEFDAVGEVPIIASTGYQVEVVVTVGERTSLPATVELVTAPEPVSYEEGMRALPTVGGSGGVDDSAAGEASDALARSADLPSSAFNRWLPALLSVGVVLLIAGTAVMGVRARRRRA